MTIGKKSYFTYTEHPEIYRETYWGCCCGDGPNNTVLLNRNNFIRDYNIKRNVVNKPRYITDIYKNKDSLTYDHMELYETHDNEYILMASPYCVVPRKEEEFKNNKFEPIYPLYTEKTNTYIRIFKKKYSRR